MAELFIEAPLVDKGYEQITGLSSKKALVSPIPAGAWIADIQAEAQAVRVRFDGTDPDTSVGLLIPVGKTYRVVGRAALESAEFFEDAASGILNVQYWGG